MKTPKQIHILSIRQPEPDIELYAYSTREAAERDVANWCRDNWHHYEIEQAVPKDDDDVIEVFMAETVCQFDIQEATVNES